MDNLAFFFLYAVVASPFGGHICIFENMLQNTKMAGAEAFPFTKWQPGAYLC